jgi:predicted  nucleic acid-binding Zn-ribbon protein
MLNLLKDIAAKQVGKVLASEATMRVLNSAELRHVVVTAINMRAGARELLETRVKDLAATLELVTREDMAHMRRSMRDLEDHIAELREQLDQAQEELAANKAADELARAQAEAKAAEQAPTAETAEPAAEQGAEAAAAPKKARKAKTN